MLEVKYVITDELGLHARPAGLLVKVAKNYKSDILLKCGEKSGDAKGLFKVMSLAVKKGDVITLCIEGEDEAIAAESLTAFLKENL